MRVIKKPTKEADIRASVDRKADSETIKKEMITKAQCCVDHLCGCK
jgi:hypothetical protein